jgi:hypothetical protein
MDPEEEEEEGGGRRINGPLLVLGLGVLLFERFGLFTGGGGGRPKREEELRIFGFDDMLEGPDDRDVEDATG